jgi:hypothetical protein
MTNCEKNIITEKSLKYYCFDWDDNILVMPTMIHLEHYINNEWVKKDITTSEFTNVRKHLFNYYEKNDKSAIWRFNNNEKDDSYSEFRDYGPRGRNAFLEDVKKSIRYNNYGPVWNEFINCIIGGHRFLIITARGHEPTTIKNAIKWIIYNVLNDDQRTEMINNLKCWNELFKINHDDWEDKDYINYYLNLCYYIGIYSDWFKDNFNSEGAVLLPEKYKAIAIKYFVEKISKFGDILNRDVEIGFSDDDLSTAESIQKYFKNELSYEFPIEFSTWHTKNDGTKTKIN